MEFFEAPAFSRFLANYLDDERYRALQNALAMSPDLGDLMPGTGGFQAALGGLSQRQVAARRIACHLLLARRPEPDLVDDHLRQE
jgi:hypothetical protein